jgi:phosphatidylserine/phosphatidylglycerophosphate/cardiolipin synthase-like enzyme
VHHKISLIVQPGDSFFPMVHAIDRAETSINLTVFRMDDPIIHKALVEACRRGVKVRLLVATSARGWEEANQRLLKEATREGMVTREPAGDSKKTRYHYKVMTLDGAAALIFTFNPTRENLHYTRDFGVEVHDRAVAAEIDRLFDADWHDRPFEPDADSPLLISPYNSRSRMLAFLGSAEASIRIADARVQDPEILELLKRKVAAGVSVQVLGDESHACDLPQGIRFRVVPRFHQHAKCVIVDGRRAVLGSMNLRTTSLDRRRELSIHVQDGDVVGRLVAVFQSDWEQKPPPSASADTLIVHLGDTRIRQHLPVDLATAGFVLLSRTDALERYPLRPGSTAIGRSEDNDVVVLDPQVSRHHARIRLAGDACSLEDLGSANGTRVNGEPVAGSVPLAPGDVIRVAGGEEFRLFKL